MTVLYARQELTIPEVGVYAEQYGALGLDQCRFAAGGAADAAARLIAKRQGIAEILWQAAAKPSA